MLLRTLGDWDIIVEALAASEIIRFTLNSQPKQHLGGRDLWTMFVSTRSIITITVIISSVTTS